MPFRGRPSRLPYRDSAVLKNDAIAGFAGRILRKIAKPEEINTFNKQFGQKKLHVCNPYAKADLFDAIWLFNQSVNKNQGFSDYFKLEDFVL